MPSDPTLIATGEDRQLIVQPDVVDLRDRYYVPSLVPLKQEDIPLPDELFIRNQRDESACTGFALAAVIDRQCKKGAIPGVVSTRMLYEMARLHDDLPDQTTRGSTLRGALKGFFHNGVCREKDAPYVLPPGSPPWELDVECALKARDISLGAYFRLNHEINDYHAAINEAGAIMASGKVHSGWATPKDGKISRTSRMEGRHAFAIIGYTRDGFLIQNSWGENWGGFNGLKGIALWTYEDWFENVEDAWVLRLAVSSPNAFDIKYARNHAIFRDPDAAAATFTPRRQDINGHFLHLDDGKFVSKGRYAQTMASVATTAELLKQGGRNPKEEPYRHLLIFAHGALQDRVEIAKKIRAWLKVFKVNAVYPVHIMWETGFNNEVVNVVRDLLFKTRERMGEEAQHADTRLEDMARPLGRKLWRDLKTTAQLTFNEESDGGQALRMLIANAQAEPKLKIHFAGVSAGAMLLGRVADVLEEFQVPLETAHLMAPACSIPHYNANIRPHVGKTIQKIFQYSLIDARERSDALDIYSKSLLYLVSNSLESEEEKKILGMELHLNAADATILPDDHHVYFAGRDRRHTDSVSHREFDRDQKTMNNMLCNIIAKKLAGRTKFSNAHLTGY